MEIFHQVSYGINKRKLVVHSLSVYMYLSEGGGKKKNHAFWGILPF